MIKKLLLTYYYVWFQGHKRSKYAHQFSNHWFHGFLQVCATVFFLLVSLLFIIKKLFSINLFLSNNYLYLLVYLVLPALCLYYLLFYSFGADQKNDDPTYLGVTITKNTRIISWIIFVLSPVFLMLMIAFWS